MLSASRSPVPKSSETQASMAQPGDLGKSMEQARPWQDWRQPLCILEGWIRVRGLHPHGRLWVTLSIWSAAGSQSSDPWTILQLVPLPITRMGGEGGLNTCPLWTQALRGPSLPGISLHPVFCYRLGGNRHSQPTAPDSSASYIKLDLVSPLKVQAKHPAYNSHAVTPTSSSSGTCH